MGGWVALIVLYPVLLHLVYNGTSGRLLYAALFHMTLNAVEYVLATNVVCDDVGAGAIQVVVLWLFVGALGAP